MRSRFTLIELMVLIAICLILIGMAISVFMGIRTTSAHGGLKGVVETLWYGSDGAR